VRIFSYLHLSISPARHLNDHVEDSLLWVGIKRDIVEWRDRFAILFNEDTVLQGVGRTNLPDGVIGHVCGGRRRCCC
jgi:hypothetical protein